MKGKLGKSQAHVLRAMTLHGTKGEWSSSSGWVWGNHSTTVRILESLTKRKLVEKVSSSPMYGTWRVTELGRAIVGAAKVTQ